MGYGQKYTYKKRLSRAWYPFVENERPLDATVPDSIAASRHDHIYHARGLCPFPPQCWGRSAHDCPIGHDRRAEAETVDDPEFSIIDDREFMCQYDLFLDFASTRASWARTLSRLCRNLHEGHVYLGRLSRLIMDRNDLLARMDLIAHGHGVSDRAELVAEINHYEERKSVVESDCIKISDMIADYVQDMEHGINCMLAEIRQGEQDFDAGP